MKNEWDSLGNCIALILDNIKDIRKYLSFLLDSTEAETCNKKNTIFKILGNIETDTFSVFNLMYKNTGSREVFFKLLQALSNNTQLMHHRFFYIKLIIEGYDIDINSSLVGLNFNVGDSVFETTHKKLDEINSTIMQIHQIVDNLKSKEINFIKLETYAKNKNDGYPGWFNFS